MKTLLAALALCLALGAPARASTYAVTTDASSTTLKLNGRLHMQSLAGVEQLVIDSVKGLFTWTYGIQASTMSLTATGNTTYALTTSTGISVGAGGVTAPWFSGTLYGILSGNLAGGAAGSVPYQSAPSVTSMLAATVNGYAMQLAGGVPSWVAAVSSATNVAGGALGSILYQSAANTSAWLAAGSAGQILQANGAAAPSWSSGLSNTVQASTGNFTTTGLNGASELLQLTAAGFYPALNGSLITNIGGTLNGLTTGKTVTATATNTLAAGSEYDNGAGAMTLPATSSYTANGPFQFSSTVTIGGVFTSTLSYSAPLAHGWIEVSSVTMSALSVVEFTNFYSSYTYRITANWTQNTSAGFVKLMPNDDTGNTSYASTGLYADASAGSSNANGHSGVCSVFNSGGGPGAGKVAGFEAMIQPNIRNNVVLFFGTAFSDGNTATAQGSSIGCGYDGSAPFTRMEFLTTGGTMTGTINIEVFVP